MAMTLAQHLVLQFHYRYCTVSVLLLLTNSILFFFNSKFDFENYIIFSVTITEWNNMVQLIIFANRSSGNLSHQNFYITFSLLLINNQVVNHYLLILFQVSGSLYGALIGSALAFTIADFLGYIPSTSKFFTVNIYYLGEMIYDSC